MNNKLSTMDKLIIIRPLGLLYGSAGRFLSPENLVGRSGVSFPPSAATLSGLFAYKFQNDKEKLDSLQLAGPFWAYDKENSKDERDKDKIPENFYVPTPMHCLVGDRHIQHLMAWRNGEWQVCIDGKWDKPPVGKFENNTWVAIYDWYKLQNPHQNNPDKPEVKTVPWKFIPHLHPRLKHDERRVDETKDEQGNQQGSLFLENAVQLDPDTCLVYLSNTTIENGWYRFGGEGHMVEIECQDLGETAKQLLNQPLEKTFALITPAVWGSNRFSYRAPILDSQQEDLSWYGNPIDALLTKQPIPMRHRLGKRKKEQNQDESKESSLTQQQQQENNLNKPGLLSRGRYAVVAGSVYVLNQPLGKAWKDWDEKWFPQEGYSFKRWGFGLALPI